MKIIQNLPVLSLPCKNSNLHHHDVIAYVGFMSLLWWFLWRKINLW